MNLLAEEDAIKLTKNLLATKNVQDSEFLIKAFSGYPILLVQGAQLLNKIKGLSREEYKKKIYQSADKIEVNINRAIKELSPSAVSLLSKIALINNQSFSKVLLSCITDNQNTLDDDIAQLSKVLLISQIDIDEANPAFEMHDVIADKLQKINGNKNNKNDLEGIILKLVNYRPKNILKAYLFTDSKTIRDNLEIISQNAEKYNVNIYKLMALNMHLITQYLKTLNFYNTEKLINWFKDHDKQGNFNWWLMNNEEKARYARYLGGVGWYYRKMCKWGTALEYYTRAEDIFNNIKGYESSKYNISCLLAEINIVLGDTKKAEEKIQMIETTYINELRDNIDITSVYTIKGYLFHLQEQNVTALEQIDNAINTLLVNHGIDSNDLLFTSHYLFKAKVLNSLGKYQEAYDQAQQLYKMHKPVKKEDHEIFARIYTQFARSELGQDKLPKALAHINKAIGILLADERRNPKNIAYSEDPDLAASYIVQGDICFAKNNLRTAIESYTKANVIYSYLYGKNLKNVAQVSYLYLQGAKVACKSKDLYNYKTFSNQQLKEFGENHPNTLAMLKYCKQYKGVADHKN